MNLKLSILLIAIFAVFTRADDLQCTGCLCAASDDSTLFARGDSATLCVHFMTVDGTSGEIVAQRAAYPVAVDTFSSVQLQGGQGTFLPFGYVGIAVQAHGKAISTPLTYLQSKIFYSSVFSVVIQINNGAIQSVIWDHRCSTCESADCYKFSLTNGTLIDTICNNQTCQSTTDAGCDPQVYVSWVGSDKNGVKMTSAGTRLSRFRQFSASELLSSKTIPRYVVPTPTDESDSTGTDTGTDSGSGSENGSSSGDNSNTENGSGTNTNTETGSGSGSNSGDNSGTENNSGTETNTEAGTGSGAGESQGEDQGPNGSHVESQGEDNTQQNTNSEDKTHENDLVPVAKL